MSGFDFAQSAIKDATKLNTTMKIILRQRISVMDNLERSISQAGVFETKIPTCNIYVL